MTAEPPVGVGSCEGLGAKRGLADEDVLAGAWRSALPIIEVPLAGSEESACRFPDDPDKRASGPRAEATADVTARWSAARRVCREAGELRGGTEGIASGCCNSLAALAVEAGALEASTVGERAGVVDPSATGDDRPAAAAVDALEGVGANAPDVTAVETLTAAVGASGAAAIVGLEGCVAAISAAKRATLPLRTCRAAATTTPVTTAAARDSRAIPHTRLRFRGPTPTGTARASDGGLAAPDASSADFTALANRSSISSLGAKLCLGYGRMR